MPFFAALITHIFVARSPVAIQAPKGPQIRDHHANNHVQTNAEPHIVNTLWLSIQFQNLCHKLFSLSLLSISYAHVVLLSNCNCILKFFTFACNWAFQFWRIGNIKSLSAEESNNFLISGGKLDCVAWKYSSEYFCNSDLNNHSS